MNNLPKNCPYCGVEPDKEEGEGFFFFQHKPGCFLYGDNHKVWTREQEAWNRRDGEVEAELASMIDILVGCGTGLEAALNHEGLDVCCAREWVDRFRAWQKKAFTSEKNE